MRWCGSKILGHRAANRSLWQIPQRLRLWIFRDLWLIFPEIFHDLSVITWRAYEFNNLLLSPPRFRRTLIVYFQLIMKFVTENWYWCLSRPSRVRWAAEKIVRKCSVPGVVFGSDQAEPQRTIPFFCWDRAAFFWQNGRAGIFKFKIVKRKNVDKDVESALSLR